MRNNYSNYLGVVTSAGASDEHPLSIHSASIRRRWHSRGMQLICTLVLLFTFAIGQMWATDGDETFTFSWTSAGTAGYSYSQAGPTGGALITNNAIYFLSNEGPKVDASKLNPYRVGFVFKPASNVTLKIKCSAGSSARTIQSIKIDEEIDSRFYTLCKDAAGESKTVMKYALDNASDEDKAFYATVGILKVSKGVYSVAGDAKSASGQTAQASLYEARQEANNISVPANGNNEVILNTGSPAEDYEFQAGKCYRVYTEVSSSTGSQVVSFTFASSGGGGGTPTHTLTWNLDGGTATGGTAAGAVAEGATLTAPTVTKDGYDFAGWSPAVPSTMPSDDATYTATWTKVYAIGTYQFDGNATLGTAHSKTVTTTASDYAAFRIDNLFFSTTKIQYETDASAPQDADNYWGWKIKYNGATNIKFFVENNSDVEVSIGSIGSGCNAKISYTDHGGTAHNNTAIRANTHQSYEAKAGTMVTIALTADGSHSVALKRIKITAAAPASYTLTYDANGGTGTMENTTGTGTQTLRTNTYTKAGCTFQGWATSQTNANAGTVAYADGAANYELSADATLYAVWKLNTPEISCTNNVVTITVPGSSTVYYTTDGSTTPTSSSTAYDPSNKPVIAANTTFKAIAILANHISSEVATQACEYVAPSTKRIYMKCGSTWCESSPKFFLRSWGAETHTVQMTQMTGCETDTYYGDIPVGNTGMLFTRQNSTTTEIIWSGDDFWGQSVDITIGDDNLFTCTGWNSENPAKATFSAGTYAAPTYTISFAGNGNTDGSMSDVSGLACGANQELTANAFTKDGYSFANWIADVAVTIGGETVDAGSAIANQATIQNITGNIALTAQWTQEVPTSVSVDGTWRCFPGQTITLTATPTGGTSDFTYQWQKYVSTWEDIEGANTSTYTKENCTVADARSYRCIVSKAGGSVTSTGYDVHIYTLNGNYNGTAWIANDITLVSGTAGKVELTLEAGRLYTFKVKDNFSDFWFGNTGYMLKSETGWACLNNVDDAIRLFTAAEGKYIFDVNIAHVDYGTPQVEVSVTYPSVTHPATGYIYYDKGSNDWENIAAHWWKSANSENFVAWNSNPWLTQSVEICGTTYYYMPKLEGYDRVIFHKPSESGDGNQTPDITVDASSSGKYISGNDAEWKDFAKYTISFEGNENTSGEMSAISNIPCGEDQAITANAFAKTGYIFSHWTADVAVTVGGATIAAGEPISNEATIQNITSDITLTAQWNQVIKLINYDGENYSLNTEDFQTGVDLVDGVAASGYAKQAKVKNNISGMSNFDNLGKGVIYHTTTNSTKVTIAMYNNYASNSTSTAYYVVVPEGTTSLPSATSMVVNKNEGKTYEVNMTGRSTLYVFSNQKELRISQITVEENGTANKVAPEVGYSVNLNKQRPMLLSGVVTTFEGITYKVPSTYKPVDAQVQIKTCGTDYYSFTIPEGQTRQLQLTTSNTNKYVVSKTLGDNTETKKINGSQNINLTAGTWYINPQGSNVIITNIAFAATPDPITVTFNSNGGSAVADQLLFVGDKVTKPADPTKSGYRFVGWQKSSAAYDFTTALVAGDAPGFQLDAVWQKVWTVTFDSDGGDTVDPQIVDDGGVATLPDPAPTKTGHSLVRWYKVTGETGQEETPYNFSTAVTADMTLKVLWYELQNDPSLSTLSYDGNAIDLNSGVDNEGVLTFAYELPYNVNYTAGKLVPVPAAGTATLSDITYTAGTKTATFYVTTADGPVVQNYAVVFTNGPKDLLCLMAADFGSSTTWAIDDAASYFEGTKVISSVTGNEATHEGKTAPKFQTDGYLGFTLTTEGAAFAQGDIVKVFATKAVDSNVDNKLYVYKATSGASDKQIAESEGALAKGWNEAILTSAGNDATGLYLCRKGQYTSWNPCVYSIAVYRSYPKPILTAMTINGMTATVDNASATKTITAEVPYNTDFANMTLVETFMSNDPTQTTGAMTGAWIVEDNQYQGSYVVTDKDGDTETYVVTLTKAPYYEAQIGENKYASVTDAIAEVAANQTIQLLQDCEYSTYWDLDGSALTGTKTVTLDLNGKNLTYTGSLRGVQVRNGAKLILMDGTAAGPVDAHPTIDLTTNPMARTAISYTSGTFDSKDGMCALAGSEIVINSGTYLATEGVILVKGPAATATVNDGVLICRDNSVIGGNGTNNADFRNYVMNIHGGILYGEIFSAGYASMVVYHPNVGTLNIDGGILVSTNGPCVVTRGGETNITGGKLVALGSGSGKCGDASLVLPAVGIAVDFKSAYPGVASTDVAVSGTVDVIGQAGAVQAEYKTANPTAAEVDAIGISGGTFNTELTNEVCAPGFVPSEANAQGKYSVDPKDGVEIIRMDITAGSSAATIAGSGVYYKATPVSIDKSAKIKNVGQYIGFVLQDGKTFAAGDKLFVTTSTAADRGYIQYFASVDAETPLKATTYRNEAATGIDLPAEVAGLQEFYIKRTTSDGDGSWNPTITAAYVTRPMKPMLTAITINSVDADIDEANKAVAITLPEATTDLAALTVVPTIVWNAAATENSIVVNNGAAWQAGANSYKLTDKDGDYTDYTITITLQGNAETPSITAQPQTQSYCAGSEPTLSVTASVTEGTLHYAWFKEAGETDEAVGEDQATYTVAGAGTYYVIVTNKVTGKLDASITSENAVITQNTAAAITTQPTAHNDVVSGTEITLSVTATNATGYQWYICDDADKTNASAISGAEAASYVFTCTASAYYYCVVGNACGDDLTSNVVAVKLEPEGCNTFASKPAAEPYNYEQTGEWTFYNVDSNGADKSSGDVFEDGKNFDDEDVVVANTRRFALKFEKDVESVTLYGVGGNDKSFTSVSVSDEMVKNTYTELTATATKTDLTSQQHIFTIEDMIIPAGKYAWFELSGSLKFFKICYTEAIEKPVIATQPATKIDFAAGDMTATVVVNAVTEGTLEYQWYNADGDEAVDGATSATLTTTEEGTYYVIVRNTLAGHKDYAVKSDEATLAYRQANDATLSALSVSAGALDPTFDKAVEEYRVDLPKGTTTVPTLTATATMAAYGATAVVTNAAEFENYEAISTVLVTAEDHTTQKTYTVHFYVAHAVTTLVDVTENTTWDWSLVTKKADGTTISGDGPKLDESEDGLILASYLSGDDFDKLEGNHNAYAIRNSSDKKVYQGASLRMHTTKGGYLSIWAANEGTSMTLNVANAGRDMQIATLTGSQVEYKLYVQAGDVRIYNVSSASKPMRVSKIVFTVDETPDYTRDQMLGAGVYGTICLPYNVPAGGAFGATFYEMAGRNPENGKIVMDEVTALEAGVPYVFEAHGDIINVFYGETHVDNPVNKDNGMYGTFADQTLTELDDVYYFAQRALWGCADLTSLNLPANRAYVKLSEVDYLEPNSAPAPGRRRITFSVNGEQTATGFDALNAEDAPVKMMIDGKLFILRGEKLFDATGRLVK